MKKGDVVYFLFTGWGVNEKPSWAIWKVNINSIVGTVSSVKMIEKVGAYFFRFRKNASHYARPKDLFKTAAEAKINLVRRLIEERIAE